MYQPQIGDSLDTLDTPAMIVDLTLMEENINRLMKRFQARNIRVRPHLKTVKSPMLAHILLAKGAIGGCVAKVSEAEVMIHEGIEDLLITTEIVGKPKLARLIALVEEHPHIKVVLDSLIGAQELNQALKSAELTIDALIDLNIGQDRCGVAPDEALLLARQIKELSHIHLIGVQGYEGHLQHVHNAEERELLCHQAMQKLTETASQLKAEGHTIEIVTTGGTGTADFCADYPGITEVQPGSFIFMDTDYRNALGPGYTNALTILSTVVSHPTSTRAIVDAGLKSLSTDSGMPEPKGFSNIEYHPGGDEHGLLTSTKNAPLTEIEIGMRIEFIPSHIDTTVNLHDYYYAYRDTTIEAIWPVTARGKVQ